MSVVIDSDNNNVNITEEPINVTVSLGGPDVAAVWGGITGDITEQEDLQTALDDKVPYTGATSDVNLGEYGVQLGNLEFDNTPTNVPTAAGSVYWSDTDGTLNMVLKGGQTISRIGETQHIRALNNTGAQIARGKVVYVVGAQGQRLTIALADADTEILSKDTIGITSEDIADGAEGFVIVQGVINNVNTNGMADGATVYLSQTAGSYTTTPPVDPAHLVILGFIVNGGSGGAGSIYVKVDNGYELGELHDVNTTGATNGQVLTYNGTTWVPATNGSGTVTSIATSAPITGGTITTSGTIGITQAGAAADGYLSSVDWNTFNNKQAALTNPVTGTGTAGQVSYWSGTGTQTGSNNLFWDAVNNRLGVGLNTGLTARAHIRGSGTTSATTALLVQNSTPSELFKVTDNGAWNFNGDGIVKGSGNTSATFALTVQNSDGNNILRLRNDFSALFSLTGSSLTITGTANFASLSANQAFVFTSNAGAAARILKNFNNTDPLTSTSGLYANLQSQVTFAPTSGTSTYNDIYIISTINQTGGANGITRGLYVNPTLTAAADWRSVEFSNNTGWGLYGAGTALNYLGGSTSIGTTTNSARLHVRGSGTTSATTALLVQNNDATPARLMSVRDDGRVYIGSQSDTQAPFLAGYTGTTPHGASQRALGLVWNGGAGTRPNPAMLFTASSDINWTSGTGDVFQTLLNFNPTSGSGVLNSFIIQSTINQTGGANGITRGLYVSPILTAAADWRSVETSNNTGWAVYAGGTANSYFGGSVGIGTTSPGASFETTSGMRMSGLNQQSFEFSNATRAQFRAIFGGFSFRSSTGLFISNADGDPSARLHVRGSGTTSATTALLVQNSTPTALLQIYDNGRIDQTIPSSTNTTIFGSAAGAAALTGSGNTFIGTSAGNATTTGANNAALGFSSGLSNTTGSNNVFFGSSAGRGNVDGSRNIFIGNAAGRFITDGTTANTKPDDSVFIGSDTRSAANTQTNQIVIGYQAIGNGSNTATLGNTSITDTYLRGNINYTDGGNFVIGTTTGTKIGTSTSQKIGLWNATPIVQPTTAIAEAAFVENSGGTAVNVDSTFAGYTIQQIAQALKDLGILA